MLSENKFQIIAVLILLFSCNGLHGKVERRESNKSYLVNSSETKEFEFTLKKTTVINDSLHEYSTKIVRLAPGDERYLGGNDSTAQVEYPRVVKRVFHLYKEHIPSPEEFDRNSYPRYETINGLPVFNINYDLDDTIVNGRKLKYEYASEYVPDTLHPLPIKHYRFIYEVTGEVEMKPSSARKND